MEFAEAAGTEEPIGAVLDDNERQSLTKAHICEAVVSPDKEICRWYRGVEYNSHGMLNLLCILWKDIFLKYLCLFYHIIRLPS